VVSAAACFNLSERIGIQPPARWHPNYLSGRGDFGRDGRSSAPSAVAELEVEWQERQTQRAKTVPVG